MDAVEALDPDGGLIDLVFCDPFDLRLGRDPPGMVGLVVDDDEVVVPGHVAEDFANVGLVAL